MNYYVFQCKLRPRENNPHKDELIGAYSHTWVHSDSIEDARVRATDLFADSEWVIEKIEVEMQSSLENHPWNHKDTQPQDITLVGLNKSWHDLHKFGIGSEISAFREETKKG